MVSPGASVADPAGPPVPGPRGDAPGKSRYWAWADLMRCTFELDVLACPRCGGRMRLLATIEDPRVIRQILTHLGLPTEIPHPRPPPAHAADIFSNIPA